LCRGRRSSHNQSRETRPSMSHGSNVPLLESLEKRRLPLTEGWLRCHVCHLTGGIVQSSSHSVWRWRARTVLIAYLSCTACTSWRMNTLSPQAVVESHPRALKVTRTDSSQAILNDPGLQGDAIVGISPRYTHVDVP